MSRHGGRRIHARVAAILLSVGFTLVMLGCARSSSAQAGGEDLAPTPAAPVAAPGVVLSPGASPVVGPFTISMTETDTFVPYLLRLPAGTTVEWVNRSETAHTVTDDPAKAADAAHAAIPDGARPWDSGLVEPNRTFWHTFTIPGVYHYFSIPDEHVGMLGIVEVVE